MKNSIKYLVALAAGAMLVSCADLDIKPLSTLASGNWYNDETEIEMSLNNLYSTSFLQIDEVFWDDDCLFRDKAQDVTLGTLNSQSSTPATRWTNCYKCISRAIGIIEGIETTNSTVSEEKKNQYLGEAYCFLGFSYGQLTTYFGDCVLIKNKMSLDESYSLSRSPKSEVMDFAYECFDKAAQLLPATFSGSEVRFVKAAAYGFKARFAMQQSDWQIALDACQKVMDMNQYSLHPTFKEFFQSDTSPELIYWMKGDLSTNYGISPIFNNITAWALRTIAGNVNRGPSYQLFCSFLCTDGLPIDESPLYEPKDPFRNRDPRMAATCMPFKTKYSLDWDEYCQAREDGTFAEKYPEYLYAGAVEFCPNPYWTECFDARSNTLVRTADTKATQLHSCYTGLPSVKFVKPEWVNFQKHNRTMDNVFPYLRYAEILMNYCEAKNELGTLTQADLDKTLNKVRERAYAGSGITYPKVTLGDQKANRKIIRMERRSEFVFENMRYRDLLRWKLMEKTQNTPQYYLARTWAGSQSWNGKRNNDGSNCVLAPEFEALLDNWDNGNYPIGGIPPIDDDGLVDLTQMEADGFITVFFQQHFDASKNYVWPIPASDILVNPNITQNPGY